MVVKKILDDSMLSTMLRLNIHYLKSLQKRKVRRCDYSDHSSSSRGG